MPLGYAGLTAGYAACHVVAILAIGMALFQRREADAQAATSSAPRLVTLLAWAGRFAAIAAVLLAVMLAGNFDSLRRIAIAVGVAIVAGGGWLLAGLFGRGAKWTYLLALTLAGLVLIAAPVLLYVSALQATAQQLQWDPGRAIAACAIAAAVLGILVLPKTRYHFGFMPSKSRKSGQSGLPGHH